MPLLDLKGVQVNFPFEPYACQVDYMEKVLECLQKGVNGILESPTGTGKTLCLLCSSLSWLETRKAQTELSRQISLASIMGEQQNIQPDVDRLSKSLQSSTGMTWGGSEFSVPKIIYASRTHSQLTQAVQELKRTAYNSVKVSVIGSREQLCIHEQVRKETNNANKVHMCRAKVNARTCHMYNRLDEIKKNSDARSLIGNVVDIEDMITYGEKQRVCPYYMARELKNDADIIFMPYNYLLDPKSRKAHGVELQGNIVIFDEAHNLEKICEDSSSFDLTCTDLATAIEELKKLSEKIYEMTQHQSESLVEMTDSSSMPEPEFTLEDLLRLKGTLTELEQKIDEIPVPPNGKGVTKPGMFIFELLGSVTIGFDTKNFMIDLLDKIINYISQDGLSGFSTKGAGLSKFCDILKIIFSRDLTDGGSLLQHKANLSKSYKVHIQEAQSKQKFKKISSWTNNGPEKNGKTLSYWCFSPGHSMADLMAHDIKCVILTSGTLSPLTSFTMEMQIPFPVTLENPHVIEKHQVWIGTVNKGPDGVTLNSNFETRYTASYQASLGNSIVNFARIVPNGLLIFFPSYPVMDKCIEYWKENNIYNRISQYKPVFVEPKGKMDFQDAMFEFYEKIRDPSLNGAIFIAVCRGKVSEGLDFADENGRAVVITGLPYPPYMDPKVVLKMQFLDEMKKTPGIKTLTGKEWYRQQASRAVNQAIGRVIRHRQDFGAILLCDTRFSAPDSISQLPIWVRPHVKKNLNFGQGLKEITLFFKTAEQKMPAPKPKKRINAESAQGAYFMPTMTRTTGPSDVMKARTVSDHVASLARAKDDSTNLAKLTIQYEGGSSTCSSSDGSKKGLLGALKDNEQKSLDDSIDGSIFKLPKTDVIYNKQAKKKITIKKRDALTEKPNIIDNLGVKPVTVTSNHLHTAESYIAEVKKVLTPERYKMFSKALVEYKKLGDLQKLIPVLVGIFTEDSDCYPLFREFYRFVRPKDKCEFDKICKDITGTSCGYKPEDAVSKKRLHSDDTSGSEKRQKTENFMLNNIQKQGQLPVKEISDSSNKIITDMCHQTKSVTDNTADLKSCDNASKATDPINNSSEDLFPHSESPPSNERLKVYEDKILKVEDIPCSSKYASGYTCQKCIKSAERPFEAACGHICCFPCWRLAFDTNKLCPVCNAKVRRRHLVAKYFAGPDLE